MRWQRIVQSITFGLFSFGILSLAQAQEGKGNIDGGLRLYVVYDHRADKELIPDEGKGCDLVQQVKARNQLKGGLNRTGTFLDPVGENGLYPTLLVFARSIPAGLEEPLSVLLKQADEALGNPDEKNTRYLDYRSSRLAIYGIFLTLKKELQDDQDRDKSIGAVCKVGTQAQLRKTLLGVTETTVEKDGNLIPNPALKPLGVEAEDDVVVVFYDRLQVVERWKFSKDKAMTAEDVQAVIAVIDARLLKKKKK
jgi:hypothetical protein